MPGPIKIEFSQYKKIGKQLGSNTGAFFEEKGTGDIYYIKWLPENISQEERKKFFNNVSNQKYINRHRNRCNNEVLAAKIYALFNVYTPEIEFITFTKGNNRYYGIKSKKNPHLQSISELSKSKKDFARFCEHAQQDFLI